MGMSIEDLIENYVHSVIEYSQLPFGENALAYDFFRGLLRINKKRDEWFLMKYDEQLFRILLNVGHGVLLDGQLMIASKLFSEMVDLFPYSPNGYIGLAQVHLRKGEKHAVRKLVLKGIRAIETIGVHPPIELKMECVDILVEADQLNAARELCCKVLEEHQAVGSENVDAQEKLKEIERRYERKDLEREQNRQTRYEEAQVSTAPAKKKKKKTKVPESVAKVEEPKVRKSSKVQKNEQSAKNKELAENIERARNEEEKRRIEEEKKKKAEPMSSVQKKPEPPFIGFDVSAALDATRTKKKRKKATQVDSNESKNSGGSSQPRARSSAVQSAPVKSKISVDKISSALDEKLSSGSLLRCICPECRSPRDVKALSMKCHTCQSDYELWYKKTSESKWVKPRMPPSDVHASYMLCKHFMCGRPCFKKPCTFAHGQDEIDIWNICRGKGKKKMRNKSKSSAPMKKSVSCTTIFDGSGGNRSRTQSSSSSHISGLLETRSNISTRTRNSFSAASYDSVNGDVSNGIRHSRTQSSSSVHSLRSDASGRNSFCVKNFDEYDTQSMSGISLDEDEDWQSIQSSPQGDSDDWYAVPSQADSPTEIEAAPSTPSIDVPAPPDDFDEGWRIAGGSKAKKVDQPVIALPIQICCSVCRTIVSRVAEPIVIVHTLLCKNCNRTEVPFQQYWDGETGKIRYLRRKPSGINNIRLCWHYQRKNDHPNQECKFAHGKFEKQLWEKETQDGASKKKKQKQAEKSEVQMNAPTSYSARVSAILMKEKFRCRFCDISFSSDDELERHNSQPSHKIAVMKAVSSKPEAQHRPPPDGVFLGRYKLCKRFASGYCHLSNHCTFAHGEEERQYWLGMYRDQNERLSMLQDNKLFLESFSQKVRRQIKESGEANVLANRLPGVILNCIPESNVYLKKNQDQTWIFDVRIKTNQQSLLQQVAFLYERHLDKFRLLRSPNESEACGSTLTTQSVKLRDDNFVEDPERHEAAVQFCVKFSSPGFGAFSQQLVLDFGGKLYLSQSLAATVMGNDNSRNIETQSVACQIYEWSIENLELVLCPKLMDDIGLRSEYNIPHDLREPYTIEEFTRDNYCQLWHTILFIEELEIHKEVARYDLLDGKMNVTNRFEGPSETSFALPGHLFGEIPLQDHLFMDEASGHLIERSVLSVIVRPKPGLIPSQKVYECFIRLKKDKSIVVEINQELCKDLNLQCSHIVHIDLKFQYNRLSMAEMHQAIDRCDWKKTALFFPQLLPKPNRQKSIPIWFMERKPNDNQHAAITMILDPSPTPPLLLIGPFGTGKTFTLNLACVEILKKAEQNKVLICTHSNSAADLHLQLLHDKITERPSASRTIRPIRILTSLRKIGTIPEELRQYCVFDKNIQVEDVSSHNVVITTLAMSRVLWQFYDEKKLQFTHILIDEAAQAMEPECISPLVMADNTTKIVLAGDHMQMGPMIYSKEWPDELGPKRPLLWRLFTHYKSTTQKDQACSNESLDPRHVVMLTENYRCHQDILNFPSDCFYGNELVARGEQIVHPSIPCLSFYTAQGRDERLGGSLGYYNDAEVEEITERVQQMVNSWPEEWEESIGKKGIGVLAPYNDQVKKIRNALKRKGLGGINVQTVENVQGQEFRALFISTVRTGWTCWPIENRGQTTTPDFAFLSDERLLNTAVTRAKTLLAVVGDPMSLCSVGTCREIWKKYIKCCSDRNSFHGCTLKTVIDFCLSNRALNPDAHEFKPVKATGGRSKESGAKLIEGQGIVFDESDSLLLVIS